MKKFTKFMVSATAMAAVAASMSIAAMAADTVTGTYAPDTGIVSLDGVISSGDQQTLLVLDGAVASKDTTVTSENASSVIAQIDQAGSISQFVLPANLSSGTYYIRIGGSDGSIQEGTLEIGNARETITIIVGDINLNGQIQANDVTFLKRAMANFTTNTGSVNRVYEKADGTGNVIVGDINLNGQIQANDVTFLKRAMANFTTNTGSVDTSIEVYKD